MFKKPKYIAVVAPTYRVFREYVKDKDDIIKYHISNGYIETASSRYYFIQRRDRAKGFNWSDMVFLKGSHTLEDYSGLLEEALLQRCIRYPNV